MFKQIKVEKIKNKVFKQYTFFQFMDWKLETYVAFQVPCKLTKKLENCIAIKSVHNEEVVLPAR